MKNEKGQFNLRGLILLLAALMFAFGILTTSVWKTSAQTSSLNYKIGPVPTMKVSPSPSPSPLPSPAVEYFLPYPGILPDNILYPLKMVRDKILVILTFDPVKKAERLLLYADKRLGAGKALIEGGKVTLGISTITKGEKYLEQAIAQAERVRQSGKDATALYQKLVKATLKHQEILGGILFNLPSEARPAIESAYGYSQKGYQKVTEGLGEGR